MRIFLEGHEAIDLDHVSLMPSDNWHGLRADLVKDLEDLHPGIFRFPGGCIVEGTDLIWFDNLKSVRSVNWYVQMLYATNRSTNHMNLTENGEPVEGDNDQQVVITFNGAKDLRAFTLTTLHSDDPLRHQHIGATRPCGASDADCQRRRQQSDLHDSRQDLCSLQKQVITVCRSK